VVHKSFKEENLEAACCCARNRSAAAATATP